MVKTFKKSSSPEPAGRFSRLLSISITIVQEESDSYGSSRFKSGIPNHILSTLPVNGENDASTDNTLLFGSSILATFLLSYIKSYLYNSFT